MKKEIRIIGIDDLPCVGKEKDILVLGIVYRGGNYLDGLVTFKVKRDGSDATSKLINKINKTKHKEQLQYIMIKGITLAGFNFIDIKKVYEKTKLPVIVVMRKKPDMNKFITAFSKINKKGLVSVKNAGKIEKVKIRGNNLYIQKIGLEKKKIKKILDITCLHSNIPEPLRVAHIIASGLRFGESKGRA